METYVVERTVVLVIDKTCRVFLKCDTENTAFELERDLRCAFQDHQLVSVELPPVQEAALELLKVCKRLLADLEGTTELLQLDEVPEHIKLSIIEGRIAIQKAEPKNDPKKGNE